jgi:hypothetical protein
MLLPLARMLRGFSQLPHSTHPGIEKVEPLAMGTLAGCIDSGPNGGGGLI